MVNSKAAFKLDTINKTEKKLRDMSKRMLRGVVSKFEKNSDEYEKQVDRKKVSEEERFEVRTG